MIYKSIKKYLICILVLSFFVSSGWSLNGYASNQKVGPGMKYLGGTKMIMPQNQAAGQMLSVVIETVQGNLIVVDGGREADAEYLLGILKEKGGHVSAWLVTHPHDDHVGALNYILKRPDHGLTIDHIYYSFGDMEWYQEKSAKDMGMINELMNTFSTLPAEMLKSDINRGYQIHVDEVKITVMNQAYICESDIVNNSSVVYKAEMNGKTALFLGDLSEEGGDRLMADYTPEELKCDIVQMAHHGQNGVKESVYQAMNPDICLWPTPGWLWDNDNGGGPGSGPWRTLETRQWMENLGVKTHYCIKDGDQIIR